MQSADLAFDHLCRALHAFVIGNVDLEEPDVEAFIPQRTDCLLGLKNKYGWSPKFVVSMRMRSRQISVTSPAGS